MQSSRVSRLFTVALAVPRNVLVLRNPIAVVVMLALAVFLPRLLSNSDIRLATEMLTLALFAASLNLLVGYTGLISLGHAAYFGVGAYTAALLALKVGLSMPLAVVAAPFASVLVATVLGAFSVRLGHAYFVMLTLAFGQLVYSILFKWRGLTGGDDGLLGVYPTAALSEASAYYYFALGTVVLGLFALYMLVESPFGYTLRAIRDNPQRAQSSGINLYVHRLIAFILAAFFAGLAGGLWAFYQASVFPDSANWLLSAKGLVMVALGGAAFGGPVLGAFIYTYLEREIPQYTDYWLLVLGLLITFMALLAPRGLTSIAFADQWSYSRRTISKLGSYARRLAWRKSPPRSE